MARPILSSAEVHGLTPDQVHSTLATNMLADGFEMVFDLEKSHDSYIYDSRSKRTFVDFFSCFASVPIGYNHPAMIEREWLDKLAHVAVNKPTNSDVYTLEMAQFVATFNRVGIPEYLPHLFLVEGGALGNENALKAAFDWKVRRNFEKGYTHERGSQVIHFREAFHGRTGYTLSLTNTADPRKYMYYPAFKWPRIINPKVTFPITEDSLPDLIATETLALTQIKQAIHDHPDDIAALIVEPIQAEGGDHHFRREFLQAVQSLCRENEIWFICDEVQSGCGLTGAMWAHQRYGLEPDAIGFGKKMQVCGCLVGPIVDKVERNVFVEPSRINSTWGGNLVDMFRSMKYLEIIEEERLVENARVMGDKLLAKLTDLQLEFPHIVSNARGLGLMCAFDLPDPSIRGLLAEQIYADGLLLAGCGFQSMRFRPSLRLTDAELNAGFDILASAVEKVALKLNPEVSLSVPEPRNDLPVTYEPTPVPVEQL